MKKLALILGLLLAIQTYGVYGAAQSMRITHTCTLEVGPLCYAWEPNTISKLLGEEKAEQLEEALLKARDSFDEHVVEKLTKKRDEIDAADFEEMLEAAGDKAAKGLTKMQKAASKALEAATAD